MQKKYLYLTFTVLLGCIVILVALLFKYIQAGYEVDSEKQTYKTSENLTLLDKENYKDSWVYKMNLQKNQNKFSYPKTVYHIKLN